MYSWRIRNKVWSEVPHPACRWNNIPVRLGDEGNGSVLWRVWDVQQGLRMIYGVVEVATWIQTEQPLVIWFPDERVNEGEWHERGSYGQNRCCECEEMVISPKRNYHQGDMVRNLYKKSSDKDVKKFQLSTFQTELLVNKMLYQIKSCVKSIHKLKKLYGKMWCNTGLIPA